MVSCPQKVASPQNKADLVKQLSGCASTGALGWAGIYFLPGFLPTAGFQEGRGTEQAPSKVLSKQIPAVPIPCRKP